MLLRLRLVELTIVEVLSASLLGSKQLTPVVVVGSLVKATAFVGDTILVPSSFLIVLGAEPGEVAIFVLKRFKWDGLVFMR